MAVDLGPVLPVKLGDIALDRFTGYEGTVMGIADYLYGCRKVLVQPSKLDQNGNIPDGEWLDEQRLTLNAVAATGGPQHNPPKSA